MDGLGIITNIIKKVVGEKHQQLGTISQIAREFPVEGNPIELRIRQVFP